jgi:hypothetical protein
MRDSQYFMKGGSESVWSDKKSWRNYMTLTKAKDEMLMRVIKDQVIKHRELEVEAKLLESLII